MRPGPQIQSHGQLTYIQIGKETYKTQITDRSVFTGRTYLDFQGLGLNTERSVILVLWHLRGLNLGFRFKSMFLEENSPLSM